MHEGKRTGRVVESMDRHWEQKGERKDQKMKAIKKQQGIAARKLGRKG